MSNTKQLERVRKIKKKYGENAFKNWGDIKSGGGSPYLLALRRGDTLIIRHKQHK
jgi:hypothetical protein